MTRVIIALCLTGAFMIVEVIGGILSGSLALLADAGHMFTDTMALGLAAVAFHVSKRPADARRNYGYQRFQILAAFVNGLSLLLIVGWILFEAVKRLWVPEPVMGGTMLVTGSHKAVGGFVANSKLKGEAGGFDFTGANINNQLLVEPGRRLEIEMGTHYHIVEFADWPVALA